MRHQQSAVAIIIVAALLVLPGVASPPRSPAVEPVVTVTTPSLQPARAPGAPSDEVARATCAFVLRMAEQIGFGDLTPWVRDAVHRVTVIVAFVGRWTAPFAAGRELPAARTVKT